MILGGFLSSESPIPSKETIMNRVTLYRRQHPGTKRPARARPVLELLEDRTVLSTLTVLNTLDRGAGSLRDAIKAARSGDTILFDSSLSGQTITLTSGELAITKSLDIEGPGPDKLAISGNNHSRVFNVSQNQKPVTVTIAGLTIENGFGTSGDGGGILNVSSTLTLINDVLSNNQTNGKSTVDHAAEGGAIANKLGATLTVSGCTFSGNQAIGTDFGSAFGGAIFSLLATLTITNSNFTGNLAQGGVGGKAPNGALNNGLALGGAIENDHDSPLSLSGCTFTGNQAIGGSNIAGQSSGRNVGTGSGGGLFDSGPATVANCRFIDNQALGGNGNTGGSGVVRVGDGVGGGIGTTRFLSFAQSLTVTDCTFTGNEAVGGAGNTGGIITGAGIGGGLATFFGATAMVSNSGFSGNQAIGIDGVAGQSGGDSLGGGIANNRGSSLIVSNCTLSSNSATGGAGDAGQNGGDGLGAGLYNDGTSTLTVNLTTVTGNHAIGGAAGSGGSAGQGLGGGDYFADGGIVCLDFFTETNISGNHASTRNEDIVGSYTIC
jgi:hypothetical protein